MIYLLWVLRVIHVLAGVYWGGAALAMTLYFSPAIVATQPAGGQVMGYLVTRGRFAVAMAVTGILTILAGGTLYWIDSRGLQLSWIASGPGIGFTFGGFFGLLALVTGIMQSRYSSQMAALGGQVQAQGTPPSAEQAGKLQQMALLLKRNGNLNAVFVVLALLGMALARYLHF